MHFCIVFNGSIYELPKFRFSSFPSISSPEWSAREFLDIPKFGQAYCSLLLMAKCLLVKDHHGHWLLSMVAA